MKQHVCTRVVGGAKQWYLANVQDIHTWDDFLSKFKQMFIVKESQSSKWQNMREYRKEMRG